MIILKGVANSCGKVIELLREKYTMFETTSPINTIMAKPGSVMPKSALPKSGPPHHCWQPELVPSPLDLSSWGLGFKGLGFSMGGPIMAGNFNLGRPILVPDQILQDRSEHSTIYR